MSNEQKPENLHAERAQEEAFYYKLCVDIGKLSKLKYAQLRTSLLIQSTNEDWKALMSS